MSYRTNRRTGGVFRTRDYTPSELESQSRRYTCPLCEAMLGHDINPAVANLYSRESGHEMAGSPISSFISRGELSDHIRMIHSGQRFPTRQHRNIGRGININVNAKAETKTPTRKRATKKKAKEITDLETMTATEPETPDEGFMTESPTEGEGSGNQGFTDDDAQVFSGSGGLLDN